MSEKREAAMAVLAQMLPPAMFKHLNATDPSTAFAGRMAEIAITSVFEPLWTDDTFDLRTRSLVTIGMLIASRATEELHVHFPAAVRNGASIADLEEIIYQAAAYVGLPAAHSARNAAIKSLREAGMIE